MRGALVCLSLLLACSDARFVVPVMPMAPKPHVHKACAPFDGKISGPPVIAATLVDAVQAATDPATGIVSFVSGNRAMNPLALNFGASVSCLPRPFPFVMVPLDAAGRQELSRVGLIRLYHDSEAEQRFLPSESLDGWVSAAWATRFSRARPSSPLPLVSLECRSPLHDSPAGAASSMRWPSTSGRSPAACWRRG